MRRCTRIVAFLYQSLREMQKPLSVKCAEVTRHSTRQVNYNPKRYA